MTVKKQSFLRQLGNALAFDPLHNTVVIKGKRYGIESIGREYADGSITATLKPLRGKSK